MPTLISLLRARSVLGPFALMASLAMGVSLAGCGERANRADQSAASDQLKQAGSDLKAAATETGAALNAEAKAARPGLEKLGAEADRGAAKLADATGDAAATAGHALDKAGRKADRAAHRAGEDARNRADTP